MVKRLAIAVVAISLAVAAAGRVAAADGPEDLIVGQWNHRKEANNPRPDDAKIEFAKGGGGMLSESKAGKPGGVKILWKVTHTFGNACIVVIDYDVPEPKPKEAKPMTWLVAMDGKDAFVVQWAPNRIDFWDRNKP